MGYFGFWKIQNDESEKGMPRYICEEQIKNMEKVINIGGIERQGSASSNIDGTMYQLIGWRHLDGNLRPALGLSESNVLLDSQETLLYVHRNNDYRHYVYSADKKLIIRDELGGELLGNAVTDITQVRSIGNILVVLGRGGMHTYIYRNGIYDEMTLPALPLVIMEQIPHSYAGQAEDSTINASYSYPSTQPNYLYPINEDSIERDLSGVYIYGKDSLKEDAYEQNCFVEAMYIRYALRMYDGNVAKVSPPILLPATSDFSLVGTAELDDKMTGKEVRCVVSIDDGYKVSMYIPIDEEIKKIDPELYPYLDIYISQPINRNEGLEKIKNIRSISSIGVEYGEPGTYKIIYDVEKKPIDVEANSTYYRVYEIEVSKLQEQEVGLIYEVPLEVKDKMQYLYQLPILEVLYSKHSLYSQRGYVYNGRLHLYDISERLFGGYRYPYFLYAVADEGGNGIVRNENEDVSIIVYIDVEGKQKIVRSTSIGELMGNTMSALVSYPDARAKRMIIYTPTYKADISLQPHGMEDMSYYYSDTGLPWQSITTEEWEQLSSIVVDDISTRSNIIKVSELNNPLLYGNDKTYQVGSGRIVSLAVATKAISQGQYGQYPMYVFTDEGVWAMSMGDAEMLYSHIVPLNRHVVENSDMVCSIDDAVVFGTGQGLWVLQGADAIKISTPLDRHGVKENAEESKSLAGVVATLVGRYKESATLRDMISSGKLAYHYATGEILLYNLNQLCYAYNIANKVWQSYDYELQYTVDDYPGLYLVVRSDADTYKVCEITDEDTGEVVPGQLLVTQSMHLSDTMNVKKIARIHLLSYFGDANDSEDKDTWLTLGIAVSNDGESWALAWSRKIFITHIHNITLPHVASAYRYFSLILSSRNIDKRSYIHSLVVEYDVKRIER